MKDWSQYGEQKFILDFFAGRIGTFCDVGAHAAEANSNTRALVELGWGGVCIEPSPRVFPLLMETHRNRPNVTCVNAAIDTETKIARFHDANGDQLGTLEDSHRRSWEAKGYPFAAMYLQTMTWDTLLAAFPVPYAFVSIDCEGASLRVLRDAPLADIGCELVCAEKEPGMREYLQLIGYDKIKETSGNFLASRS